MPERPQVAERLALGAVAAGLGPGGERALVVGERPGHPVEVGWPARVGEPRSAACSSASSARSSGRAALDGRQRVALVAVDDLRQVGGDEPAAV